MSNRTSVTKLLAPTVPLVLEVEGGHKLELKLAWTMRGIMMLETALRREYGIELNVLQRPSQLFVEIDCTRLALAVWAFSQQEHKDLADEKGFDLISSFLVPDNYKDAIIALKKAFVESLSPERREEIRKAEEAAKDHSNENPTTAPTPPLS